MRTRLVLAALGAGVLLAGCSSTGGGTAGGTSSSSAAGSSGAASTSPAAPSAGCPSVGGSIPAGARTAPTIDVDGDGRPDTEWIATTPSADGGVPFGVRTASGAVVMASIQSASPAPRSVMFADVTGHGEIIALASDNRQVLLYAFSQCQIIPEQNLQGQQYAFDLGFTGFGTGVGCADVTGNGTRNLLGLKLVTDASGNPTSIQRTIVELDGPQARNGATSTVDHPTAQQAELARSVTCGNLTLAANGVSTGP
jgi:hypothetical protein